jgi:hypothetical protein
MTPHEVKFWLWVAVWTVLIIIVALAILRKP